MYGLKVTLLSRIVIASRCLLNFYSSSKQT